MKIDSCLESYAGDILHNFTTTTADLWRHGLLRQPAVQLPRSEFTIW